MNRIELLCQELQKTWHNKIPLSDAMGLKLDSFGNNVLTTRASLAPNINVHGTAFAGSLYSAQALTGWGMLWLQLKLLGIDASIVLASGQIEYLKPLGEALITSCDFAAHVDSMDVLIEMGRARFKLECTITGKNGLASQFSGDYAVMLS